MNYIQFVLTNIIPMRESKSELSEWTLYKTIYLKRIRFIIPSPRNEWKKELQIYHKKFEFSSIPKIFFLYFMIAKRQKSFVVSPIYFFNLKFSSFYLSDSFNLLRVCFSSRTIREYKFMTFLYIQIRRFIQPNDDRIEVNQTLLLI